MNKNNTPEQKAAWKASRRIGSRFIKVTPAPAYNPEKKQPSRLDIHRAKVAARKAGQH